MFLDCTLRDGGYYNSWDFPETLIDHYLRAMQAAKVDVVELGMRTLKNEGFSGASAFTTDDFIRSLNVPKSLMVAVMVNGSELVRDDVSQVDALERLFPQDAVHSPVQLVRVACHVHEFERALPASMWLKERGYKVGFNLMQIADRSEDEVKSLARVANGYPLDVLYFADSFGSMTPQQAAQIVGWLKGEWPGELGIHTHENLGLALSNTLRAMEEGVTWVDATVTGMGRGPGNCRTEELAIELANRRGAEANMVPLMELLRTFFRPLQAEYGWGSNPYYYLAGKYGIHPTYIQTMLADPRYSEEDKISVIEHLRLQGGKKYNARVLNEARQFYSDPQPAGSWKPAEVFVGKDVLLLGTGPGVAKYRKTLERFIAEHKPVVIALNTQTAIDHNLVDLRIACQPVRLLADADHHVGLPEPLIAPYSLLPEDLQESLDGKQVLDYGLYVEPGSFAFGDDSCVVPSSVVSAYAFAAVASGKANSLFLAGFDGYGAGDARNDENNEIVKAYLHTEGAVELTAITPTPYDVTRQTSVYGLIS